MLTKAQIFNLALQALLLNRQIVNPDADKSNESKALQVNWEIALRSALSDMNLTSTCTRVNLELVATDPVHHWRYAYKYPSNCAFFRRVISHEEVDDKHSHIPKLITIWNGQKVIFIKHEPHHVSPTGTPTFKAVGEYIQSDFPLQTLQADAAVCIAYKLASLTTSLIVGKGSKTLNDQIRESYKIHKALAQAVDANESFSFQTEATMSEFVEERLS